MLKELYTAALGMMPQMTKLEVTSNNIANGNTVGFKREGAFERELISARQTMNHLQGSVEQDDTQVSRYADFTQGALQKTGNQLDVALDGKGFFVVQDDKGDEFYTRAGHFTLSSEGRLSTPDGKQVMGDSGAFQLREGMQRDGLVQDEKPIDIHIKDTGEVFANDQALGKLQIMTVENPQTLKRDSATLFIATDKTVLEPATKEDTHVKQGHLENSNVNIIAEMVQMIQLQRNFELGQKVISTNNDTLDRSMDLGRFA